MMVRLILLVLGVGLMASALPAQGDSGLASELPAETFLYFEVPDVQAIVNGAAGSSLGRIYNDPDMQEFVGGLVGMIRQGWDGIRASVAQEGIPAELIDWGALRSIAGGMCLMPSDGEQPSICVAVSIGLRNGMTKAVFEMLSGHLTAEGEGKLISDERGSVLVPATYERNERFEVWTSGERIVARWQYGEMPHSSLADSKVFRSLQRRSRDQGGLIFGYMDLGEVIDFSSAMMRKHAPAQAQQPVNKLFEILGLRSIGVMSMSSGWKDNGDSFMTMEMGFREGGPQGVFLIGAQEVDLDLLKYVPDDATAFTLSTGGLNEVWDMLTRIAEEVVPPDALDMWEESGHPSYDLILGSQSGLAARAMRGFGQHSFSFAGADGSGGSFSQVTDVESVREFFKLVMPMLKETLDQLDEIPMALDVKKLTIRERDENDNVVTREGPEYYSFKVRTDRLPEEMRPATMFLGSFRPTFGVSDDGWLVFNMSSSASVRKILRSGVKVAKDSIRTKKEVKDFLNRLPAGTNMVSWSDPRPGVHEMVTMAQGLLPMVAGQIPQDQIPVDLTLCPGPDTFTSNMRTTEAFAYFSDGTFRSEMVGSLNLVDGLVLLGAMTAIAVPVAMMAKGMGRHESEASEMVAENPPTAPAPGSPVHIDSEANKRVLRQLGRLEAGVQVFKIVRERLPANLQEVTESFEDFPNGFLPNPDHGVENDPWGRAFVYRKAGRGNYKLYSMGPNGKDEGGAGDDIALESD